MKTLPDYFRHNLSNISIGLNPSPISVQAGFYYANPRNRFWKALNGSRLLNTELEPGETAMLTLYNDYKIGFTDLVKRPTRMGHELRAADYREGALVLKDKLLEYRPAIAWFHGIGVYKQYLKYAEAETVKDLSLGVQRRTIGKTSIFVSPNPSPANARYSLDDLIEYYNDLVSFQIREAFGLGTH
jgi:double-stranded uracil-DNA glycosylase